MLRFLHARVMLALGHVHLRASRVGACVARHRDTPLPRAGMVRLRLYPLTVPRLFEPMACARVMGIDQSLALRCLRPRSEEHTSELQSLMRISYAVFCLKKKKTTNISQ